MYKRCYGNSELILCGIAMGRWFPVFFVFSLEERQGGVFFFLFFVPVAAQRWCWHISSEHRRQRKQTNTNQTLSLSSMYTTHTHTHAHTHTHTRLDSSLELRFSLNRNALESVTGQLHLLQSVASFDAQRPQRTLRSRPVR